VASITVSDPPTPIVTVSAFDPDAAEAGLETGTFRFTRTGDLNTSLTVSYTRSGTAVNGTDYANIGGTVTFISGQATADRVVVPINDALVEAPETVTVMLTDGASYDLGASTTATVTIADQPVPTVSVQAIDDMASEAGDAGLFRFTRTGDTTFSLSFTVSRGGTASNNSDYSNISTTITIPAGEATFDRTVAPINDTAVEGNETLILTVVDGPNYDVGSPSSATVTILDQPTPIITVVAIDPDASETGPDTGVFRFTRVGDISLSLTISFTRGGTAASSDFASIGTSVTFFPNVSTVDRSVTPTADAATEGPETVIVTLTDGTLYNLGTPSAATITITD
jgi:hypothetical protein